MARFFVQEDSITENTITITGPDVKHISRVLRLAPGDKIEVAAGDGREFEAVISEISNKAVVAAIVAERLAGSEPPIRLTLYQGLPKGDKMELIIQKSTELGVTRIVPVICERTVVKLDPKKIQERHSRWQRVAGEAAKQSRRAAVPEVDPVIDFKTAVAKLKPGEIAIMPWEEQEAGGLKGLLKGNAGISEVSLFIGPEGGFSHEEVKQARDKGLKLVTLGPRIMRTETAGIVTAAIILYELGDLGGGDDG